MHSNIPKPLPLTFMRSKTEENNLSKCITGRKWKTKDYKMQVNKERMLTTVENLIMVSENNIFLFESQAS